MMYISGLLVGLVFGLIVKKSRFCLTGLVRDIYMEKRGYNVVLILSIIATEGLIYHGMGHIGIVRIPSYLPPFSMVGIAIGSFLFGFGAVMMNGCLTSTLIKCGDGRVIGLVSLATFMIVGYFFSAGAGIKITDGIRSIAVASDDLAIRRSMLPVYGFSLLAVITYTIMYRHRKAHKPAFEIPGRYSGIRHILFEKVWPVEVSAPMIGVVLGLTFAISGYFGRHNGFAIATPILSWIYSILRPEYITGGCNPYDQNFGWGSMLVLGIVLGSFVTTLSCGEYSMVMPARGMIAKAIIGSALMAVGAMWGLGCLLVNGLVGTAQLSLKSWYALIFLVLGIWSATRIFLIRGKKI